MLRMDIRCWDIEATQTTDLKPNDTCQSWGSPVLDADLLILRYLRIQRKSVAWLGSIHRSRA